MNARECPTRHPMIPPGIGGGEVCAGHVKERYQGLRNGRNRRSTSLSLRTDRGFGPSVGAQTLAHRPPRGLQSTGAGNPAAVSSNP